MDKKDIVLRPYQEECIKILDKTRRGNHMVAIATGLGKTVIFSHLKQNGRTLILSHRDELVRQPEEYYDVPFGIEKANEHSNGEPVVSASVQTLSREDRLRNFGRKDFSTIIIDEAHHAAAPSYRNILSYFTPERVLGFTATPKRGDGIRLDDVFEDIVYQRDIRWGIDNGYLTDIRAVRITSDFDLASVKKLGGDFNEGQLSKVLMHSKAIEATAKAYVESCHRQGKHSLIFTVSVELCEQIRDRICELLPEEEWGKIEILTGTTPMDERRHILKDYTESGGARAIVNCMVLTEGADLPVTDAIVCVRPTCNDSLYQQMIGRGLRLYPGKRDCLVLDVVAGNYRNKSICTAPTLFGIDPAELTDEQAKDMEEMTMTEFADKVKVQDEALSQTIFGDIEITIAAFDIFTGKEYDRIMSGEEPEMPSEFERYYVHVSPSDDTRYKIEFGAGNAVFSKPDVLGNTMFRLYMKETGGGVKMYAASMRLSEAVAFLQKVIAVYADPNLDFYWSHARRTAWEKIPATEKQVWWIKKHAKSALNRSVETDNITKAQASDLIALIKQTQDEKAELDARAKTYERHKNDPGYLVSLSEAGAHGTENELEKAKRAFPAFEADLNRRYFRAMSHRSETKRFKVKADLTYRVSNPNIRPTAKQMELIGNLVDSLEDKAVLFSEHPAVYINTIKKAMVMIDVLKRISAGRVQFFGTKAYSKTINMRKLHGSICLAVRSKDPYYRVDVEYTT